MSDQKTNQDSRILRAVRDDKGRPVPQQNEGDIAALREDERRPVLQQNEGDIAALREDERRPVLQQIEGDIAALTQSLTRLLQKLRSLERPPEYQGETGLEQAVDSLVRDPLTNALYIESRRISAEAGRLQEYAYQVVQTHGTPQDDLQVQEMSAFLALHEQAEALQRFAKELTVRVLRGDASAVGSMPISIYLADEGIHEQVEMAAERWLATANVLIERWDKPIIGSWFRRMLATSLGREAVLTATHIADSRLVQTQDAYVTSTLLQNVAPVLQALQPTKDAIVRAGALLIVKVDWVVQVYQLTAAQQAILDHRPQLASSPREIISALELTGSDLHDAVQPVGRGGAASATSNRD